MAATPWQSWSDCAPRIPSPSPERRRSGDAARSRAGALEPRGGARRFQSCHGGYIKEEKSKHDEALKREGSFGNALQAQLEGLQGDYLALARKLSEEVAKMGMIKVTGPAPSDPRVAISNLRKVTELFYQEALCYGRDCAGSAILAHSLALESAKCEHRRSISPSSLYPATFLGDVPKEHYANVKHFVSRFWVKSGHSFARAFMADSRARRGDAKDPGVPKAPVQAPKWQDPKDPDPKGKKPV